MIFIFFILFKASIPDFGKKIKESFLNQDEKVSTGYFIYYEYKLPEIDIPDNNKALEPCIEYNDEKLKIYDFNFEELSEEYIKYNSILIECFYEQNKRIYFAYNLSPPNICDKNLKTIPNTYIEYDDKGIPNAFYNNKEKVVNPYFTYNMSILKIYNTDLEEIENFKISHKTEKIFTIYDHKNKPIKNAILSYEKVILNIKGGNDPVPNAYISYNTDTNHNMCISHPKHSLSIYNPQKSFTMKPSNTHGNIIQTVMISYNKCNFNTLVIESNQNSTETEDMIYETALNYKSGIKEEFDKCIQKINKTYGKLGIFIINNFLECIKSISELYINDHKEIIYVLNQMYNTVNKYNEIQQQDERKMYSVQKTFNPIKKEISKNSISSFITWDYIYIIGILILII